MPVRQGFGPIRLVVRVTQENDLEKICKQHFVVLRGFNPLYLLYSNHKKTHPRGTAATPARGEARPRPEAAGQNGRDGRDGGSARSRPPAAAAIITKSCI